MRNKRILSGAHFWQGDVACAEGALAAGCHLFAGYPITPATEVSEHLARRLPQVGGVFVQGADEIDSLGIVLGAAWGGWRAMTATSGNGISLMQEGIGYAAITETPCVIIDVQRAGPAGGCATKSMQGDFYQIRYGSNADYSIIALAPSSPQEFFHLTVEAFNLAELYRSPVFVLADETVAHMRERVVVPESVTIVDRKRPAVPPDEFVAWRADGDPPVPPMPAFGEGFRMPVNDFTHSERGVPVSTYEVHQQLVSRLWNKIEENAERLRRVEEAFLEDAKWVVISYGGPARAARSSVRQAREKGLKVGFLRLITLWPFPDTYIRTIAASVEGFLVCEMSMGKLVREVERAAAGNCEVELFSKPGVEPHYPQEILERLEDLVR
jgi:2-oxoglutarate ferredoxin oxidoreductase subunit alpha